MHISVSGLTLIVLRLLILFKTCILLSIKDLGHCCLTAEVFCPDMAIESNATVVVRHLSGTLMLKITHHSHVTCINSLQIRRSSDLGIVEISGVVEWFVFIHVLVDV